MVGMRMAGRGKSEAGSSSFSYKNGIKTKKLLQNRVVCIIYVFLNLRNSFD